jgi:AraC family transcriptional regulator of adaptative response / DNA-3-methyladenine glycosylase II
MFDLDAPTGEIAAVLGQDARLARRLREHAGIRVPGAWDGFELTVRAVLGQQVSVKAATTMAGRIADRYGDSIKDAPSAMVTRLFPTAGRLVRARFNGIGLTRSRADTLRGVARVVVDGSLRFDSSEDPEETRKALLSIRGIGEWTAEYVAMRALKNPDAFPASDLGLLRALANGRGEKMKPAELEKISEGWRPWRAYAALLLWSSTPGSGG